LPVKSNYRLAATEPLLLRFAKGNRELLQAVVGKARGSFDKLARVTGTAALNAFGAALPDQGTGIE
jgi:hypothetical protein